MLALKDSGNAISHVICNIFISFAPDIDLIYVFEQTKKEVYTLLNLTFTISNGVSRVFIELW